MHHELDWELTLVGNRYAGNDEIPNFVNSVCKKERRIKWLNVVRYYLTHSIGVSKVAAKFNISDSQVYNWAKKFNEEGYAGLLPKQKGRPRKVPKKSKKTTKKLELSEKQKYEEKILKQEAELERLRVENLVLKKVAARYPRYPTNKKHN